MESNPRLSACRIASIGTLIFRPEYPNSIPSFMFTPDQREKNAPQNIKRGEAVQYGRAKKGTGMNIHHDTARNYLTIDFAEEMEGNRYRFRKSDVLNLAEGRR